MAKEETLEEKNARLESELKLAQDGKKAAETALQESQELIRVENEKALALKTSEEEKFNDLQTKHNEFVETAYAEIGRLSQELDSANSDAAEARVTTTVDGKKYQILGKSFNIPGRGVMLVPEILKDKALLKDLVNQGAGFIVPAS